MTTDKIMIDNVDISGCEFAEETDTTPKCTINNYIHCDGYNCHYKQLQRCRKEKDKQIEACKNLIEENKNLKYILYEERNFPHEMWKATLKIATLERRLHSAKDRFSYELKNLNNKLAKTKQALMFILNNDDKPACIYEDNCPLNGGDGFDNHCNMSCPFIIAKQVLENIGELPT